jgi:predicted nucleic acid-binding protein
MSRLVLLDSGPLAMVTNPLGSDETARCNGWLLAMLDGDAQVLVPEICDYEVRRELVRAGKVAGLQRLDELAELLGYLPVTTDVWRRAADLWAQARAGGYQAAADAALDGDMLLAAQAQLAAENGFEVLVATTNVGHLGRFAEAREWESIEP